MLEIKTTKVNNITFNIENSNNILQDKNSINFSDLNINPIVDNESSIINIISPATLALNFLQDDQFYQNLLYAGLSEEDIIKKNKYYRYSTIIMMIYDDINIGMQNFVHISYIPLYNFSNSEISVYNLNPQSEYMYIYLNNEYQKNKIYYCRFYFNNIKNGKIYSFRNNNFSLLNDSKLYYELYISDTNVAYFTVNDINLYQINNIEYDNIIENKTLENKNYIIPFKQNKIFDINGKYINIS